MQRREFSEEFRLEAVKLAKMGEVPISLRLHGIWESTMVFFIVGFASMMAS